MIWQVAGGILVAYFVLALLPWIILAAIAAWRWIAALAFVGLALILLIAAPNVFILLLAAFLAYWLIFPARKNRASP